jgi:vacuolar-type H+-ATPase subunit H
MPTNIESFVETLQAEGVDAGKKAAQEIKAQAEEQADQIIAQAKATTEQMIADAQAEAEQIKARMDSSLELATRDTLILLREKLGVLLNALLKQQVEKELSEEETLSAIMREVILAHSKPATGAETTAEIHVPQELQSRLLTGAIRELARALKNQNIQTDVKASLDQAGFEYKIDGSTLEVSAESVAALLADMIDPQLQQILEKAVANPQE